jgi:hypothetical protein
VEEEWERGAQEGPVASALGQEAVEVYDGGASAARGADSAAAADGAEAAKRRYTYLTQRVGMFPDVVENLVHYHWNKQDTMSALVAAEWCASR